MLKTVWKFQVRIDDNPTVCEVPNGGRVVGVGLDPSIDPADGIRHTYSSLCIWIECNPKAERVERMFCIHGTGHLVSNTSKHLGVVIACPFAWHVYEVTEAPSDTLADPVTLVHQLDPQALRDRIDTLDREREALLVLLRAAQRAKPSGGCHEKEGPAR